MFILHGYDSSTPHLFSYVSSSFPYEGLLGFSKHWVAVSGEQPVPALLLAQGRFGSVLGEPCLLGTGTYYAPALSAAPRLRDDNLTVFRQEG